MAKEHIARSLEELLLQRPDAPEKVIQIAEDLKAWAEEKRNTWRLQHGSEEEAEERYNGRYWAGGEAPEKAPWPIRQMVGSGQKRHFDRMKLGPCVFCKRMGHNTETCMVMPTFSQEENQTPLQSH